MKGNSIYNKIWSLTFLLLLIRVTSLAQNDPLIDIQEVPFSSSSYDDFLSTSIDPNDSSVYAAGFLNSDEVYGNINGPYQGGMDGILAKYSFDGNLIWSIYVGGANDDYISDVQVSNDGRVLVTGQIRESGTFFSTNAPSSSSISKPSQRHEAFIASYSPDGELLWVQTYGGAANDVGLKSTFIGDISYSIIAFDNVYNDVIIDGDPVPSVQTSPDQGLGTTTSYALIAHDGSGNLLWKSYFGSDRDDIDLSTASISSPYSLIVAGITEQDNRLFLTAMYSRVQSLYDSNNNLYELGDPGNVTDDDIMFMEYDLAGVPLWQRSIWITGGQDAKYLGMTSDCNGLYLSATLNGSAGIFSNGLSPYYTGTGYDPMIFKASLADGEILWHRELITNDNDYVNDYVGSLSTDGQGNLFIIGGFQQTMTYNDEFGVDIGSITPTGPEDMFLAVMDVADGKISYIKPMGNQGIDYGLGIDTKSGVLSMVGTGTAEDEFEFPPISSGNPSFNFALGITRNNMCFTSSHCTPLPTISAGSLSTTSPGPYCFNEIVSIDLFGNSHESNWYEVIGGTWTDLGTGMLSYDHTVTEDVNIQVVVKDGCGRADTTAIALSLENIVPVAQCVSSHNVMLDEFGGASITVSDIDNGSWDNCGGLSHSLSNTVFSCSDLGSTLVQLTVTDEAGNSNTCSTAVEVLDPIAPEINCPSDVSVMIPAGSCSVQVNNIAPVSYSDNCGSSTVTYEVTGATTTTGVNDASGILFNEGISTVTYTADDGNNQSSCSFSVTADPTEPTISINDGNANENQPTLDLLVELSHVSCTDISVQYITSDLSATSPSDYIGTTGNSLIIPTGALTGTISIPLVNDLLYEGNEDFEVLLTTADYGTIVDTVGVATIVEDDFLPALTLHNQNINETDGQILIQVQLSSSSGLDVSFDIISINGTADEDDYEEIFSALTIVIPAGDSRIDIPIAIDDDVEFEGDEVFSVELSNPINAALGNPHLANITIIDNEGPLTVTAWPDFSSECNANQSLIGVDIAGGCGTYVTSIDSFFVASCGVAGAWTYNYVVTDACNVTVSDSQEVTITDTTSPTLIIAPDTVFDCGTPLPAATAIASDACNSVTWASTDVFAALCGSTYTVLRTFAATDACGNTSQQSRTIAFIDTIAPAISLSPDLSIECGSIIDHPDYSVSNNCGAAFVSIDSTFASACGSTGTWNYVYTAIDECGNSSQAQSSTTLVDTTQPLLSIPADITIECGTAIPVPSASVSDFCGNATWYHVDSFSATCSSSDDIIRTYTAVDECSNTISSSQIISIVDSTSPTLTIEPDTTVSCDSDYLRSNVTTSDACGLVTIAIDSTFTQNCGSSGDWTYTFTATDQCGNSITHIQVVTREDLIPPTIIMPVDQIIECDDPLPIPCAEVLDNCGVATWSSEDEVVPSCGANYEITRTYTSTDECGNTSTSIQTITAADSTPPSIVLLDSDLIVECDQPFTKSEYDISDNCGNVSISIDSVFTAGCGVTGSWVYAYTAVDECGNSTIASQNIQIIDTTPPSFTINEDVIVECASDFDVVGYSSISDCNDVTIAIDSVFNIIPDQPGSYDIHYTMFDACGNDSTQTQLITLQDTSEPEAITQDISVPLNALGHAFVFAGEIDNGSYDNCSAISLSVDIDTLFSVGEYTVQLMVEDEFGNSAQSPAIVTVFDAIAPDAYCQNVTIYLDDTGLATLTPAQVDMGSTDNSGTVTLSLYETSFDCSNVGSAYQDTLFVSDGYQISYCLTDITVLDTIAPVLSCPDTLSYIEESLGGIASISIPLPDVIENCSGSLLLNDYNESSNASDDYPFGLTPIEWVISNNDQQSSCITIIELIEYIEPMIDCVPAILEEALSDECGTYIALELPQTANVITLSNDFGNNGEMVFFPVGESIVTWTTMDDGLESLSCQTVITIIDNTAPTVNCLPDTVHCGLSLSLPQPDIQDNCATTISYFIDGISNAPLNFAHMQATEVMWQVSDGTNTSECITTVTAHDNSILAHTGIDQDLEAIYEATIDALIQSDGTGYWTFIEGDGVISNAQSNITTVSQLQTGTNILEWTVESDVCGTSSDQIVLNVKDFMLPTAFSPNGDGINDRYRIVGINTISKNNFNVYNKWGKLVYSAKNYTNDWNGDGPLGNLLAPDTYYFTLEVIGTEDAVYKGYIELRY